MRYILYIFLGILLYFYSNLKEKLLIHYDITQMNRCKAYVCPTTPRPITDEYQAESDRRGDCAQQCIATYINSLNSLDDFYMSNLEKEIVDYMAQHVPPILGKPFLPELTLQNGYSPYPNYELFLTHEQIHSSQTHEFRQDVIDSYENPMDNKISSSDSAFNNLKDLFSKLLPNSSRVLIFIKYEKSDMQKYLYHVVIIARSSSSIFMLDPKHRVIMKNKDIWNNPWLDINFNDNERGDVGYEFYNGFSLAESFKWNLESVYVNFDLYFLPVVNVGSMLKTDKGGPDLDRPETWSDEVRNDINPNFKRESIIIDRLLREASPNLVVSENEVYQKWIRRLPNGIITDPREFYAPADTSHVHPPMPPREYEPCDPINDAKTKICKRDQNCYHKIDWSNNSWNCERDELHIDDNILGDKYCSIHNDKCAEGLECKVNDIGIGTCQLGIFD